MIYDLLVTLQTIQIKPRKLFFFSADSFLAEAEVQNV